MANQMVCFSSLMVVLKPSQSFTIGSMTWIVGANGIGEIMATVQNHPAPIMPTSSKTSIDLGAPPLG
jgi:hypothetical protein